MADISHKSVSDDGQQAPPITDHFLLQLSGLARLLEPSGNFFVLASYLLPRAVAESREHYRVSAWATPLATTGGVGV